MASKNAEIAKDGADALFVLFAFSEVDSPGSEDGAFHSCLPETTCNCGGGANQLDWDPGDLAMTYVPGLAQVSGTYPATGAYAYFAADHLGSTRGMYNQSKAMTAALEYSPYGEPRAWRGDAPAPTYTGHYRDAESGLYFAPYRYYQPGAGRWLTRDPLGMVDGPHVYGYVMGRPIHRTDSSGLFSGPAYDPTGRWPWHDPHPPGPSQSCLDRALGIAENATGATHSIRHCVAVCEIKRCYGQWAAYAATWVNLLMETYYGSLDAIEDIDAGNDGALIPLPKCPDDDTCTKACRNLGW